MEKNNENQNGIHVIEDKNRNTIIGIVLIGIFMASLDAYMVNIALPTITNQFNVSIAHSQWIITGYLLIMTGLFIFFGKISEYTGKTKLFILGFSIFTLSSLICGISPSINQLILFRLIQAVGASMVLGVGGALIFQIALPEKRGRVMGLWGATTSISALIGPVIGGFITSFLGWPFIFIINVPIGIFLLLFAFKYLKIPEITSDKLKIDWIGVLTLFTSVVSVLMFFNSATDQHVNLAMVGYGTVFLVSTLLFILREWKCDDPLLDLSIFRNKLFTLPIVSMMLFNMALITLTIVGPFYFQGVMGYSPFYVGLFFMTIPLFMAFTYPISGKLYDKYHWKYFAGVGALTTAFALILLSYAFMIMNIWLILLAFIIRGVGGGLFGSPNGTETMSSLPPQKSAIASGVMFTTGSLAMAIGASFASILLSTNLEMFQNSGNGFTYATILTSSTSLLMLIAGCLCIFAAVVAIFRNISFVNLAKNGKNSSTLDDLNLEEKFDEVNK